MENVRHITETEERIGKYATRKTALRIAKEETQRTGVKHTVAFTHYMTAYDDVRVTCWTTVMDFKNRRQTAKRG